MKLILLYILAFTGGVFLAVQAGFNTQLGSVTKQPILAVVSTSLVSICLGILFLVFTNKAIPPKVLFNEVPTYLWFIGGAFSMVGISLYFYVIPQLGISKMIALGLCGQLLFSLIAGSLGWLNLPVEPLTTKRILGAMAMTIGIFLINSK